MPNRDVPTIRDVARLAGVSVATVSRVLNRGMGAGEDRRRRVTAAVARLGYRRDGAARNLRRRSTVVWGLVISDIENPFFTSLVRGVQDTTNREGYSVVLLNSDEDVGIEASCLHVLVEERVAGVILSPVSERSSNLQLVPAATPVVLIDRRIAGANADTVCADHRRRGADDAPHRRVQRPQPRRHRVQPAHRVADVGQRHVPERGDPPPPAAPRGSRVDGDTSSSSDPVICSPPGWSSARQPALVDGRAHGAHVQDHGDGGVEIEPGRVHVAARAVGPWPLAATPSSV